MNTVFFGPFVGEFGWELLHWQGWVNKMCATEFHNARKIVCGKASRKCLYRSANEYWSIPDNLAQLSGKDYITDNWERKGAQLATDCLTYCQQKLPVSAKCFVPWRWNTHGALEFGVRSEGVTIPIPLNHQHFDKLKPFPTMGGGLHLNSICILPRCRLERRPDKNWPEERYRELIKMLLTRLPDYAVVLIGEPGGAYFDNHDTPEGCVNMIHNPSLNTQLHILQTATLAVGGESGGMVLPLSAGCPSIIFGREGAQRMFEMANPLGTPLRYYPDPQPTPMQVFTLIEQGLCGI